MSIALSFSDCHNDLLLGVLHQTERGVSDPFGDFWLPQLKTGGVNLQVLPVYIEEQFVGEGALRRALVLIETAWKVAEKHGSDVKICLSAQDISEAHKDKKIALVLAIEGAEPLGHSLDFIDLFFRVGIRMLSLTWNRRTMFADGVGERDTGGRLTTLGIEAIGEMERLGMIVDVSHLSENGFWHVSDIATKAFVASHSSCFALMSHPRNLKDDQLQRIVGSGGLVALNAFGGFLAERPTVDSMLDHVDYAVRLLGSESVGFGFDFMRDLMTQVDPVLGGALVDINDWPFVSGLDRPSDLANFGELLIARFGQKVAEDVAGRSMTAMMERLLPQS
jgi:membrane dipeptidase